MSTKHYLTLYQIQLIFLNQTTLKPKNQGQHKKENLLIFKAVNRIQPKQPIPVYSSGSYIK